MSDPLPVASSDGAPPEEMPEASAAGYARIAEQWALLPGGWRGVDRAIVRGTEGILVVAGVLFTAMITLEVILRYVFSFSISFVNAAARLLLVWFFMLGAGIAMRHGAHVGFELLVSRLSARRRHVVVMTSLVLTAAFCIEMTWAGCMALGAASAQTEPGLGISLLWPLLAIPVGFALLLYHAIVVIRVETRRGSAEANR